DLDLSGKPAVHRVVLRQMRVGLGVAQVVEGDDLHLAGAPAFVDCAQDVAADAAVPVDSDLDGHIPLVALRLTQPANFSSSPASRATCSAVKPKYASSSGPFPEAPKRSRPITRPSLPT